MLYTHTAEPLNTELETPDADVKVGEISVKLGYYLNANLRICLICPLTPENVSVGSYLVDVKTPNTRRPLGWSVSSRNMLSEKGAGGFSHR